MPIDSQLDETYSSLGRRVRRYARQARAEGVTVKEVPLLDSYCKTMHNLMQTANGGKGIPGQQTYEYYTHFWRTFHEYGSGSLFFAYEGKDVVAGLYAVQRGASVIYKDGGSTAERKSKGAVYYLHAEVMRHYAAQGCTTYDMWGSPPRDAINDTLHPLYGIGQFKLAFSKEITEYSNGYEVIVNAWRKKLWSLYTERLYKRCIHWKGENFW